MSKFSAAMAGIVLLIAGLSIGTFVYVNENSTSKSDLVLNRIREGEELLKQTNKQSIKRALKIYNELASRELQEPLHFRVKFGQAVALEKNQDRLLALKMYKDLIQSSPKINSEQREKLEYHLGNLLLKLNQEEEGKAYLGNVLRTSENRDLRSLALTSIADMYFEKRNFEKSRENYSLALQEDRYNVHARIGLDKSMQSLGRESSYSDVFAENLEYLNESNSNPVLKKKPKKEPALGNDLFEKGKYFYLKKKYVSAISYFQRSLKVSKTSVEKERNYYYLADSYLLLGKLDLALENIRNVITNPDPSLDAAATFKKGVVYFKLKKYKEAIVAFNEVLDKYPEVSANITSLSEKWRKEALDLLREEQSYKVDTENSDPNKEKSEDSEDE